MCLMEKIKAKEEGKPIPVPRKSEAPKKVLKQLLCIQKDMKSLNAEVESMCEKGEFEKYALQGYGLKVNSLEAELIKQNP